MNLSPNSAQWEKLTKELKVCDDLFQLVKDGSPMFDDYSNWLDIIDDFSEIKRKNHLGDQILKPVLDLRRDNNDARWNIVLTALFWHILESIFCHKHFYHPGHPRDLWQNVNSAFLEAIDSPISKDDRYTLTELIYWRTLNILYQNYKPTWHNNDAGVPVNEIELSDLAGSCEDEEFHTVNVTAYLRWHLSRGIISNVQYHLLERAFRYREPIEECASRIGLSRANAKKQYQRALKKIREIEKKLSPLKGKNPLSIFRGGDMHEF
jgi:hypothetical protein